MKTKRQVLVVLSIAVFLFITIGWSNASANFTAAQTQSSILYVKPAADGECSSWEDACDLLDALSGATSGDQIWVASGTYKPSGMGSDRYATFQLLSGVAIYGCFPASGGDFLSRDPSTYITTLSGDIDPMGNHINNSYHVVTGNGVDATAVLDGFTISWGRGNSEILPYDRGAGIINYF